MKYAGLIGVVTLGALLFGTAAVRHAPQRQPAAEICLTEPPPMLRVFV